MGFFRRAKLQILTLAACLAAALGAPALSLAQTLDELHKLALKEGGALNFYATLAQVNAEIILPIFEKRFAGIKVNHVDARNPVARPSPFRHALVAA